MALLPTAQISSSSQSAFQRRLYDEGLDVAALSVRQPQLFAPQQHRLFDASSTAQRQQPTDLITAQQKQLAATDQAAAAAKGTTAAAAAAEEEQSSVLDIRSQRLSDTYRARQLIFDRTNTFWGRFWRRLIASYVLRPLVRFLFPRVLNNNPLVQYLLQFAQTTQVQLLCEWTCPDGHICKHYEGHTGRHECVFGHVEGKPIRHCPHVCDCRGCDAECSFEEGHSGIHKCYFAHYWNDIPATKREQEAFRDEKAIGDYVSELAYSTPEEMRFTQIPEVADPREENWTQH